IVAISDRTGGYYNKNGIDIEAAIAHARKVRSLEGFSGGDQISNDDLLMLDEKGIFVVPDILANAGGVTVSYFEWVQDRGGYFWTEDVVNERLTDIMCRSFADVLKLSTQH